jgi:hypothetical protein
VAYNYVTHAQRHFVNKALFTCGSVQPISLETLLVTITDKIASLILFTNCQLFEAISKSKTNVLELNTIK